MTADWGYLARALCESSPMTDSHGSPDTPASPSAPKPPLSLTVLTSVALFVAAAGLVAMGISTRR